jgi:hypothetical protein
MLFGGVGMGLVGGVKMKIDRLIEIERKEGTNVGNHTRR